MSKTLRLSIIATLFLASAVLAILSYNILNPKPKEEITKTEEPAKQPAKKRTAFRPSAPPTPSEAPALPPPPPPQRYVRIISPSPNQKGFTIEKCWNFECGVGGWF